MIGLLGFGGFVILVYASIFALLDMAGRDVDGDYYWEKKKGEKLCP